MPNNGIKIYTETRNGVQYGIDPEADIYKVLKVSPSQTLGAYCDRVCCNEHGKINRLAKFKPYAFGTYEELTDNLRKAYNYGMTPTLLGISYNAEQCYTPAWGQWSAPVPGTHWCRITDFEDYNHLAAKFIKSVELRTTAGPGYTVPIYRNPRYPEGTASLYGRVVFDNTGEITLSDITVNGVSLGDLYLTIGITDHSLDRVYVAQADVPVSEQAPDAIVEMVTTAIYNIDGVTNLDELGPNNKVFFGLYPKITVGPGYVSRDFTSASLSTIYSLDMWADGFRQVAFNAQAPVMFGSGGAGGEQPRPTTLVVYAQPSFSTFNIAESSYDTYTRTLSVRPGISFGYQQRLDWVQSDELSRLFEMSGGWWPKFTAILEIYENDMLVAQAQETVLPNEYKTGTKPGFDMQWAKDEPVYFEFVEGIRFEGIDIISGVAYRAKLTLILEADVASPYYHAMIKKAATSPAQDIRFESEFTIYL